MRLQRIFLKTHAGPVICWMSISAPAEIQPFVRVVITPAVEIQSLI